MDLATFRELIEFTAQCLTGQHQGEWTVASIDNDRGYPAAFLDGPGHAQLRIRYGFDCTSKVTITAMMPSKYNTGRYEWRTHSANVAPERGGKTIANEARRRVLDAGYLAELPEKWAEQQEELAESAVRTGIMARVAGLFGLEAPGDAPLDISRFLPNKAGTVEMSASRGDREMSIKIHGLDPEVGMAMLRALASSYMVSCSCCRLYGPGHHPQFEAPGCLREKSERGELASRHRVAALLLLEHGAEPGEAARALDDARTSRYEVAVVMSGTGATAEALAVVRWDQGRCGEFTVELAGKGTS